MFTFLALSLEAEEERRRCEEGQKDATLLALKMEEEAKSQEMWVSSRGWKKARKQILPKSWQKECKQPCHHLGYSPVRSMMDF